METIQGTIYAKAGNGLAFATAKGVWFNIDKSLTAVLAGINKGDTVTVSYEKKGVSNIVSSLVKGVASTPAQQAPTQAPTQTATGFKCETCGKTLKDGKFKKCYVCGKAAKAAREAGQQAQPTQAVDTSLSQPKPTAEPKKEWKSNYGSPEDVRGKRMGCALAAASAVLSGAMCIVDKTPEEIAAIVKTVALSFEQFLDR